MALPTGRMLGTRYVLREGGTPTTLGGGFNAALEITRELMDTFGSGDAGWRTHVPAVKRWNMTGDLDYLSDGTSPLKGCTADFSIGGVGLLEGTRFTLTCDTEFAEAVTTDSSCGRIITPSARTVTIDFEALFVDPLNASAQALEDMQDYANGTSDTALAAVLTLVSGHTLTFNCGVGTYRLVNNVGDHALVSGTAQATGAVTMANTGLDAGVKALLDSMFIADIANMTATSMFMENVVDGIGATEYTGSAYPSNVTFDVDVAGKVTVSLAMEGSGDLTIAAGA